MIKQIRYFQSVVRLGSFTAAADEHLISQSAISQQIKALEDSLGVPLLTRKGRSFELTSEGEYFYKKSLVIVADLDSLCGELRRMSNHVKKLGIGVPRGYSSDAFRNAVALFSAKYPDTPVEIVYGSHEELYELLQNDEIDAVLGDHSRALTDEYTVIPLAARECSIEISAANPISQLPFVEPGDLKNIPFVIIAGKTRQEAELNFYREYTGLQSDPLFTDDLENAKMLLIQGRAYMLVEGGEKYVRSGITKSLTLRRNGEPILRRYCIFLKAGSSRKTAEDFTEILRSQF